jgi:hypothetical protein
MSAPEGIAVLMSVPSFVLLWRRQAPLACMASSLSIYCSAMARRWRREHDE